MTVWLLVLDDCNEPLIPIAVSDDPGKLMNLAQEDEDAADNDKVLLFAEFEPGGWIAQPYPESEYRIEEIRSV